MAASIGYANHLYYNSTTYDSPTWNEITIAKDVKIPISADEADVSTRGNGGWKAMMQGLKELSFEFGVLKDPEDGSWDVLQDCILNGTNIDLWATVLPEDDPDAVGLRAVCQLFKFDENQALSEGVANDIVAKPTYVPVAQKPDLYQNPSGS